MSTETAMIFAEIYKNKGEWKFKAVGQGFTGGLRAMANFYNVEVE
jgi:tellurium resistance protein TerD